MWQEFESFNLDDTVTYLLRMLIAYVLALPTAFNRERYASSAGLRTFPLVAVGACGYMLIGRAVLDADESYSRVVYGIVTGIGFIGGGAILKGGGSVHGTATAASIWNMGAIGIAVAWQRYEIALVLAVLSFITLYFVAPLKEWLRSDDESLEDRREKGKEM